MGFVKEFRDFAVKGNVMDMAVGVIIGGAFGKIVGSMVNDIMMPVLGQLTSGIDFKDKFIQLAQRDTPVASLAQAKEKGIAVLSYGAFINEVITFTIVAFAVFLLVKGMNKLKKQAEAAPAAPAGPSAQELLLMEIRDELRKR
jgi:large conductance mechanosensitive channel